MAVTFVPVEPESGAGQEKDRENLAEVIDLRTKFTQTTQIAQTSASEERTSVTYNHVLIAATKTLARKAMSSGELRSALIRQEYDEHLVEEVIDNFERRNFLDDLSLAETLTEKLRRTKQSSKQQISLKLAERKISREIINEVLSELDQDDEHEVMRGVAYDRARKLGSLDRATAERRLAGFLQRRGWGGSGMRDVIRDALDSAGA